MPNPYVNKVQKSDGTTILDITDTTAVAGDVAEGKYFYLATGQKVSGTASGGGSVLIVDTPDSHGGTIREITAQSAVTLQNSVTITPSEASQTINPSSGYDGFRSAFVEAIPSEYVIPSGTLSISENGTYDVSAFASAEVLVSGGGGGSNKEAEIIERTISGTYENSSVTTIGAYAFNSCSALSAVRFQNVTAVESFAFAYCYALSEASFPSATTIGNNAFYSCIALSTASFPNVTTIGNYAFNSCRLLSEASFQNATIISNYAFYGCSALSTVSFPSATSIGSGAFRYCSVLNTAIFNNQTTASQSIYASAFANCYNLISLYLLSSTSIYTLSNINAFTSTPISTYTTSTGGVQGSIFVPEGIYNSYITATNWATYTARFVSLTSSQVQHVIDYGTHVM